MLLTWPQGSGLNRPQFALGFKDLGAGAVDTSSQGVAVAPTYTRAGVAQALLGGASAGTFGQVAGGTARSWYTNSGLLALGYMAEGARVNLCVRSLTFNADWVVIGTPTISTGTTVLGSVQLDTIGDDSAAALEGYSLAVTFTGDAVKSVGIFMKAGTSTSSVIRLRDGTASADRLLAVVTWAGGVPTVAMTTGTDLTGTISAAQLGTSGAYWLKFATTSVTAASSHQLEVYPATNAALSVANTGTVQVGVVNEEDATFPSSPIITTGATVTRNADNLLYPTTVINTAQGTVFAQISVNWTGNAGARMQVFGTVNNNGMLIASGQASTSIAVNDGTTETNKTGLTSAGGSLQNRAIAWGGDMAATGNGLAPATSVFDGDMLGGATSFGVGIQGNAGGGNPFFGTISGISYFARRLPDSALISLTT